MKIMRPKKVMGGAGGGGQCEVDAGGRWAVQIGIAKMRAAARAQGRFQWLLCGVFALTLISRKSVIKNVQLQQQEQQQREQQQ